MVTRKILALALLVLTSACDDAGSVQSGHAPADVEAGCAHFEFGPFVDVAIADGDPAPVLPAPHTRYDLQLAEGAGTVRFTPPAAQRYILLMDSDVPVVIADAAGTPVEPAVVERGSIAACGSAAAVHHVDLGMEGYTFSFGPAAGETLALVVHQPMAQMHGGHGQDGGTHSVDTGHGQHVTDAGAPHADGGSGTHDGGEHGADGA